MSYIEGEEGGIKDGVWDSALGHCPVLCPGDAEGGSGLVWEGLGLSLVLWGSNCLGGCREHRWRMERDLGGSYIWNCL